MLGTGAPLVGRPPLRLPVVASGCGMAKQSAGLLLYRPGEAGPEVLLVHPGGPFWARKDEGAWSVPKGELGPGDDALGAALREFEEELGTAPPVAARSLVDLGSVTQKGGKVVRVWAAPGDLDVSAVSSSTFTIEWPPRSGRAQEFPEVDRAAWFPLAEARRKLVPAQAELVDRLEAHLRHARGL
jgi:predicted NUDIX family NTP pyrophosphohydrolase